LNTCWSLLMLHTFLNFSCAFLLLWEFLHRRHSTISKHFWECITYTAKNGQVVAILMKTGLNNALLPTLFTVVNNIEQYCYTRFRLNNIVQYCWQVWTTWAAKHYSILQSCWTAGSAFFAVYVLDNACHWSSRTSYSGKLQVLGVAQTARVGHLSTRLGKQMLENCECTSRGRQGNQSC
jgi:hypothetical protein